MFAQTVNLYLKNTQSNKELSLPFPFHSAGSYIFVFPVEYRVGLHIFDRANSENLSSVLPLCPLVFRCKLFGQLLPILGPPWDFLVVDINSFLF